MHYFSPVPAMPLLEIVVAPQTSKEAAAAAVAVGQQQGKTCIVVKDSPGFYTTRALAPLLSECISCVHDGASLRAVDEAMRSFGMPVGQPAPSEPSVPASRVALLLSASLLSPIP